MRWSAQLESCQLLKARMQELWLRKYSFQTKPGRGYWGEFVSSYLWAQSFLALFPSPFPDPLALSSCFPEWTYCWLLAVLWTQGRTEKNGIIFLDGGGNLVLVSTSVTCCIILEDAEIYTKQKCENHVCFRVGRLIMWTKVWIQMEVLDTF